VLCCCPVCAAVLQVYREAVASERCSAVHLTRVEADPHCDTHFPDITAEGKQCASNPLYVVCYVSTLIHQPECNVALL
jgi:predicted small integral membrane protein